MDVLRERLGVEATLQKGSGGIFTVAVGDKVVARKTWTGFPNEEEIVAAVEKELVR